MISIGCERMLAPLDLWVSLYGLPFTALYLLTSCSTSFLFRSAIVMLWASALILSLCFDIALAMESYEQTEAINTRNNFDYGYAMYGFWGGVIFFGIIRNAFQSYRRSESPREITDAEQQGKSTPHTRPRAMEASRHWIQTYVTTPPAFGTHRARLSYWCTIPTRAEFLVIVAYWIVSIVLVAVGYETYSSKTP